VGVIHLHSEKFCGMNFYDWKMGWILAMTKVMFHNTRFSTYNVRSLHNADYRELLVKEVSKCDYNVVEKQVVSLPDENSDAPGNFVSYHREENLGRGRPRIKSKYQ
jgi:hypothetical protein